MKKTSVVVVRHGERLDYILRDESETNWIKSKNTIQPWNTPLTQNGCNQAIQLGNSLISLLKHHDLPPISAVYSSPFLRCIETATKIIEGLKEEKNENKLKVCIETALIESICENWYRQWCLPESDSTWGYRKEQEDHNNINDTVHLMAKEPIQSILKIMMESLIKKNSSSSGSATSEETQIKQYPQEADPFLIPIDISYIPTTEQKPATIEIPPYQWGTFESKKEQRNRMLHIVNILAKRHQGETFVIVSHGGPVTHLYQSLMKDSIFYDKSISHGTSKYTCCTLYTRLEEKEENGESKDWKTLILNDTSHLST